MKTSALILITFLLSTQISAQVKTGGGPEVPIIDDSTTVDPTDKLIGEYMAHLMNNDEKCASGGGRLIKDRDLMQVYLKLSLFKNSQSTLSECDEANRYLSCINDDASKKYAWRLGSVIGIEKHIGKKYNIPNSEVIKMLKFFSELGKKVE